MASEFERGVAVGRLMRALDDLFTAAPARDFSQNMVPQAVYMAAHQAYDHARQVMYGDSVLEVKHRRPDVIYPSGAVQWGEGGTDGHLG